MTRERTNYYVQAIQDSWETVEEFADQMVEQWEQSGEVSDDLNNDYSNGDEWHHLQHVGQDYSLREAAELLDQLRDYEKTDYGLWEGLEPRRAIAAQAAYTYGGAVYDKWRERVGEINVWLGGIDAEDDNGKEIGSRFIRLWAELGPDADDHEQPELRTFATTALDQAITGELTGVLALADWFQENDKEYRAKKLRELCS